MQQFGGEIFSHRLLREIFQTSNNVNASSFCYASSTTLFILLDGRFSFMFYTSRLNIVGSNWYSKLNTAVCFLTAVILRVTIICDTKYESLWPCMLKSYRKLDRCSSRYVGTYRKTVILRHFGIRYGNIKQAATCILWLDKLPNLNYFWC